MAAIVAVVLVSGAGAYWRSVYWTPARDLRRMGFEEIHWWNLRQSIGRAWIDGSSQTYVYRVSEETERRMRQRCLKVPNEFPIVKNPPCYLYRSHGNVSPDVSVTLGRGAVVLDYVWF